MSIDNSALWTVAQQLARIADALEKLPCPTTPSGAKSAGTYGTENRSALLGDGQPTTTETLSWSAVDAHSAPPPTEEPFAITNVRTNLRIDPNADPNYIAWSQGTARTILAAYDAERAKLARIAAILSNDSLENPQKIGRALRVAKDNA